MPQYTKLSVLVVTLLLVTNIPGCDNSNDVVEPSPEVVGSAVQAASPAAVGAAGDMEVAGDTLTGLMDLVTTSAALGQGGVAAAVSPSCPSSFELPSGLTGSCTPLEGGGVSFVFGGTVPGPYGSIAVDGTLIATPTANQPATGSQWSVDFDATAQGPLGSATWSASGTFTLDENDDVVNYSIVFTHTRTPEGGSPTIVSVTITPTQYTLVVSGSGGHVVRFNLDRANMTGTVLVDGFLVANITFGEGCAFVNFVNPALEDLTICPGGTR